MSKRINVNPDHYKVAGREHSPGEAEPVEKNKQQLRQSESRMRGAPGTRNFIPGAAPVGQSPAPKQQSKKK